MEVQQILRRVNVVRERPSRVADVLREPRNLVIGGRLLNALGLQVARTAMERVAWRARLARVTPRVATAYHAIARDGIVVIPNFLAPSVFSQLQQEVAQANDHAFKERVKVTPYGVNFASRELLLTDWAVDFPVIVNHLRDSPFLLELASAVSRRRQTFKPHVILQEVHKPSPENVHTDLDYNQYLHVDKHFAFIKAFYYVNDVSVDDGPYSYARGSHVVDLERLRYEYAYSLAYTRIRKDGYARTPDQLAINREFCNLAEAYVRRRGLRVEPIAAKANTMIVSNNIGFHRRAELRSMVSRVTLNLDYKYLESPAQVLYPLLRHLY